MIYMVDCLMDNLEKIDDQRPRGHLKGFEPITIDLQ